MLSRRGHSVLIQAVCIVVYFLGTLACFAQGAGYWHTSGGQILDANGTAVRIAGINWYGFETTDQVAHGLNAQDYKTVLQTIKNNGYNTIRLPLSNQMVESPTVPGYVQYSNSAGAINADLQGLNSLQILDAVIAHAGAIGLRVILDNHRSEAGNGAEPSGLWYTDAYPESAWISDWVALANRYKGNTTVIGMDVRNEPHNANTGGSCWSCGDIAHDWHIAAAKAGNAILAVNPNLLIFVEGTDAFGNDYYFWGGQLAGVASAPVTLIVAQQIVYSAHDYGPREYPQPWFNGADYSSLVSIWRSHWGYIAEQGIAPVWVGEFGTPNANSDAQDSVAGSEGQWFSSLVQYLQATPAINWTYWALNGEDLYGLLNSAYDATPANALKQQKLASIQFSLTGSTPITAPTLTLTGTPSVVTAASSNNDTGDAETITLVTYSAVLANGTAAAVSGATLTLNLPSSASVISSSSTGSAGSCTAAAATYRCTFSSIASGTTGGIRLTAVFTQSSISFGSANSVSLTADATAQLSSGSPLTASVATTVNQRPAASVSEMIQASASPGATFSYGTAAVVNFSLAPAPTTVIPITAFSAVIDGSTPATVSSTGTNAWQIQLGNLVGGLHSISINMAANPGYTPATATLAVTVSGAAPTLVYVAPVAGTYGAAGSVLVRVTGGGVTVPTGTVALTIDGGAAVSAAAVSGQAQFAIPSGTTAGTHSLQFSYGGDINYTAGTTSGNYLVNPTSLVAVGDSASRPYGASNPAFTGVLTGVVSGDGITATYASAADAMTAAGAYATGPNAVNPTLGDPNSRLGNYKVSITPGVFTITSVTNSITWSDPAAIVYGISLSVSQLNAIASPGLALTYSPPAGTVLNAGTQTLKVSGVGATETNPVAAQVSIVVQPASTVTILTAPITITSNYTLIASVTSAAHGATTGSVNFYDNGVLVGTGPLDASGTASFVVPTLTLAAHSYTAIYPGDRNNLPSSSVAVAVGATTPGDFILAVLPDGLTLTPGTSSVAILSASPMNGIRGPLSLACTNLPANVTCTLSPSTLKFDGSINGLTTKITVGLSSATANDKGRTRSSLFYAVFLPCLFFGSLRLRVNSKLRMLMLLAVSAILMSSASGCGSGTTTTGTYNAIITAKAGTVVHTATIPIALSR